MTYYINIPYGNGNHFYRLLPFGDFQEIDVPGVLIFNIWKYHDHRYDLEGFFYSTKKIISCISFKSKKDLYCAIHILLQENLNVDVQ